jgi:hypothetical protein
LLEIFSQAKETSTEKQLASISGETFCCIHLTWQLPLPMQCTSNSIESDLHTHLSIGTSSSIQSSFPLIVLEFVNLAVAQMHRVFDNTSSFRGGVIDVKLVMNAIFNVA